MPRTSTAKRSNDRCPLCGKRLTQDLDHRGWVRHAERPDVEQLLSDPSKCSLMSAEDIHYLQSFGLCPFEHGQKDDIEPAAPRYEYLGPWPGTNYRQYFLKDRKIRAETLYRRLIGPEPMTPEEVAEDYGIPVNAVYESIAYCEHNQELLRQEREADQGLMQGLGLDHPSAVGCRTCRGE